jgi:diguanylate cyclase (GGDEF)-like protein
MYCLLAMILFPFLSFIMGYRWISEIENISEKIKSKSAYIMGDEIEFQNESELEQIQKSFYDIYDELQNKMSKLNEVQKHLVDSNTKLREMAIVDDLTALYNRRYFNLRLKEETNRADRYQQGLSLIMIDFDDFKQQNDIYGHQTGDKLLREVANLIRSSIRQTDLVFRYGGDEFAVLLLECDIRNSEHIAKELVKKVNTTQFESFEGKSLNKVTISCGVASYSGNMDEFVSEADKHLFEAKNAGKGLVSVGV